MVIKRLLIIALVIQLHTINSVPKEQLFKTPNVECQKIQKSYNQATDGKRSAEIKQLETFEERMKRLEHPLAKVTINLISVSAALYLVLTIAKDVFDRIQPINQ